jgi:hypothetical protein
LTRPGVPPVPALHPAADSLTSVGVDPARLGCDPSVGTSARDRSVAAGRDIGTVTIYQQVPAGTHPASCEPAARLAQLPFDTQSFVGRGSELAQLVTLIPDSGAERGSGVICVIDGMAGVGKTTTGSSYRGLLTS